jgi:tripartite-type tricarboxylate transporter receptor subunit TctC
MVAACASALAAAPARAQDWPTRPIEIAVFSAAGGGTDLANRVLAKALEEELKVPIRVSNMTGGRGGVAANYVYNAQHDGYRWLGASASLHSMAVRGAHPTTSKDWLFYMLSSSPSIFAVRQDSPFKTFDDVLKYVKENPGKFSVAPISQGAPTHILMEALRSVGNFDYNFIPYDGAYPSMMAAVSGEVDAAVVPVTEATAFVKDGRLRVLAMLENEPYTGYGEPIKPITDWVPAMKAYTPLIVWLGFMVPADTPAPIVKRLDAAFKKIQDNKIVQDYLANTNTQPVGLSGPQAAQLAERQESIHSWVLDDLKLTVETPTKYGIKRPN